MAITLRVTSKVPRLQPLFDQLQRMGADPKPILKAISFYGENSTRERFDSQTGPDGEQWLPSLRAMIQGGKTLTKDGHLGDSITSANDGKSAKWGTNRIYAAIHQFGGTITAKTSKGLRFQVPGAGWVTRRSVTLPARPYLGLSADDQDEIVDIVQRQIDELMQAAAPRGN